MTDPIKKIIAAKVQSVCEWDDRTSPEDYPNHLLITPDELAELLEGVISAALEIGAAPAALKPLTWSKSGNQHGTQYHARGAFGFQHTISNRIENGQPVDGWHSMLGPFDTLKAAKAAAQSYYNNHTHWALSAIAPLGLADDLTCPICAEIINEGDLCATEITEGTCHAACLEGSAIVDLENGEPSDGPISTYLYERD